MPGFSARDVQALRRATGVGMLDARRALQECGGDMDAAVKWLREKGLAEKAKRQEREASEGTVAAVREEGVAAIAELRCETDFVAKSAELVSLADELAAVVAAKGEDAVAELADEVARLAQTLGENVSVGRVARLQAGEGEVVDTYLHQQAGRGVNGVAVVLRGGTEQLAHDVAVHIAFARPLYLRREDVPEAEAAAERETLEAISRREGKPEAALAKIVEGRMNGWFRERVLLEQPFVRDEKQTVGALLGDAEIVRFAQVVVGS
ncbi:MAG TPA: translation elongation factor Ts [Acidimicrobiales bacterium]|nr:translation elongation factor Ts [Acidimicrobiales bacterium]